MIEVKYIVNVTIDFEYLDKAFSVIPRMIQMMARNKGMKASVSIQSDMVRDDDFVIVGFLETSKVVPVHELERFLKEAFDQCQSVCEVTDLDIALP